MSAPYGEKWVSDCGTVTLYCGDCLEVLPTLEAGSVDITVSSPPYNMIPTTKPSGIYAEHNHKLNAGYDTHGDNMPQDEYEQWVRSVFQRCIDVSCGLVWINHKVKYQDKQGRHPVRFFPWPIHGEIIWDRGGSLTLNANRFAPSHESIYAFGEPHYWNRVHDTQMTVWRIQPERRTDHPCPFPIEIPSRCIEASCPVGGVVLDPFSGSGTTAAAAIRSGRRFIGCELSVNYFDASKRRIIDELNRVKFLEPPKREVQRTLLEADA